MAGETLNTSQTEKANSILQHMRKISPNSNEVKKLALLKAESESAPKGVSAYIGEAQKLLRARNLDKAFEILNQSLTIRETAAANELLGEILLVKGKTKEAIEFLEKAYKKKTSHHPKLLYNLTSAYYLTGQYDKAWQTFLTFREMHPNFADRGNLEMKIKKAMKN